MVSKSNVLLKGDFNNSNVEIQSIGHAVELDGTFDSVEVKETATVDVKGNTSVKN